MKPNKFLSLIIILALSLTINSLNAQSSNSASFEDFWSDFSIALGNNAKANIIKKDVAAMTNFTFEMNEDGTVKKYNQKKFLKDFDKIFEAWDKLCFAGISEFKVMKADASYTGLGVAPGSDMYYITIDNGKFSWSWYKFYFGKVKGKYKLVYVEAGT